jgi:hypothetical protein
VPVLINFYDDDVAAEIGQQVRTAKGASVLDFTVGDPLTVGERLLDVVDNGSFLGFVIAMEGFIGVCGVVNVAGCALAVAFGIFTCFAKRCGTKISSITDFTISFYFIMNTISGSATQTT